MTSASTGHTKNSKGLHNLDPPKWLGLGSDVVLWLLLLSLAAGLIYLFVLRPRQAAQQTVTLSFQDSNEVSPGALVRMMGTTIGYVERIDLMRHRVKVIVKTNPGGVTIPRGSTFTINFTGLVGSKNIEVIPPFSPTTGRENRQGDFFVEEPIRLQEAQQSQIEVAKALEKGAENFSDFFGKQQPVEELQHNIRVAESESAKWSGVMANAKTRVDETASNLHAGLNKVNQAVYEFSVSSEQAANVTNRSDFGPNVISVVASISRELLKGQRDMASFVAEHHLQRYKSTASRMDQTFAGIGEHITPPAWYAALDRQNQSLFEANQALERAENALPPEPILQQLHRFQQVLTQFNQTILGWNQGLEENLSKKKK
ncbi:MAG: MCE family protein [Vampirovibrionales bacterium]|nr:MCE family protein [Vampirovibrionales bacterium]